MPSASSRTLVLYGLFILTFIPFSLFVLLQSNRSTFVLWLNENLMLDDTKIMLDSNSKKTPPHIPNPDQRPPLVLLISYDGFRHDYIEKYPAETPTFQWLIKNGVYAPQGLKNTFITITAPNHYGIVTGLYEESHGVIANSFFDPVLNESFAYFDTRWKTNPAFFGGDPIWNLNDRSGPNRATGCIMWVGCDVAINKQNPPIHHVSWDGSLDWSVRVDSIIDWFSNPNRPINFGILYIEEPDETGHNYGPDSPELGQMLKKLDQLTAYLLWRLHTIGIMDKIDIIFTADHGMASVPLFNVVNLDKYVNSSLYTAYGGTPNWNVSPKNGSEKQVYNALKKAPHMTVYNKSEIPQDYHYRDNRRIMPLQVVADVHWWLAHNFTPTRNVDRSDAPITIEKIVRGQRRQFVVNSANATTGEHGYNNSHPDMHPYFIAYGPSFKKAFNMSRQAMNLDLYPLMCYLLGLNPSPNNGSFERIRAILRDEGAQWSTVERFSLKRDAIGETDFSERVIEVQYWTYHSCMSFKTDLLIMLLLLMCLMLYFIYLFRILGRDTTKTVVKCDKKERKMKPIDIDDKMIKI